ncbi:MAG: cupin domain-containing protein [Gammaproteobacteria bacterium]
MSDSAWKVFYLPELLERIGGDEPSYLEYLRKPGLSSGVYHLPAGAKDMQAPHLEDEIYLVIEGKARLRVAEQEQEVGPGSILYVQATADHSFFDIEEDLTLLACFGPIGPAYV